MPGNKVQEASNDIRAQLRLYDTRQTHHASVLAFCASETGVQ
jgi:hypothetical protein